jgi:hypothetical protein
MITTTPTTTSMITEEPSVESIMHDFIHAAISARKSGACDAITPSRMVDRELIKWSEGKIHGDDLIDVVLRELGTEVAHNIAAALGL